VPLKLLLAGCSKADRERLEPMIEGLFRGRPAGEAWTVSLVRIGERWSVSLDGPDARLRGATFMSDDEGLRDRLTDTLRRGGFALGGPAPPAAASPPAPPAPPAYTTPPTPSGSGGPPRPPTPSSPPAPSIYAAPSPPRAAPAAAPPSRPVPAPVHAPGASGEMRDRIECEKCNGSFTVVYDLQRDEPLESVPVACPHCWHVNRTMVGQWAATGKEYRAEKIG
jgi:hypothetical protein